mmetsp:Transcript_18742/g.32595  ORF Transcript_18742/g.32595 Transcript_18742/m.32595 type:complete len:129 (+) Transcript_18742:316-702(+)
MPLCKSQCHRGEVLFTHCTLRGKDAESPSLAAAESTDEGHQTLGHQLATGDHTADGRCNCQSNCPLANCKTQRREQQNQCADWADFSAVSELRPRRPQGVVPQMTTSESLEGALILVVDFFGVSRGCE